MRKAEYLAISFFFFLFVSTNVFALTVNTNDIADGAVTDAKISGVISASKIQKHGKVAVVAQSGGDYTDPVTAMTNLNIWCGTPSAANPCLLKILPGVYNIGGNTLQMQSYVDIEGSGEKTTKITGNVYGALVSGANAEIRFVTIENTLEHAFANTNASPSIINVTLLARMFGLSNDLSSSPVLANVTIKVDGGDSASSMGILNNFNSSTVVRDVRIDVTGTGNNIGIRNDHQSSLTMTHVTIDLHGGPYGIYSSYASSATIKDSTITGAAFGVVNQPNAGAVIKIDHSLINASANTIWNASGAIYIADTKLEGGPASNPAGTLKCVGVYDGDYNSIICP